MAIQDTTVIDFVSLDSRGNVVLTVSDHLDWTAEQNHLLLLQEKINTYCTYVENGQLYDEFPESRDRRPLISLVLFHEATPKAAAFLAKVKTVLDTEGFSFEWKPYEKNSDNP